MFSIAEDPFLSRRCIVYHRPGRTTPPPSVEGISENIELYSNLAPGAILNLHDMRELSYFSGIAHESTKHVSRVMTGIAAMPPNRYMERHLVFKPRAPETGGRPPVPIGGSQSVQNPSLAALQNQLGGGLYYMQLVANIENEDAGKYVEALGQRKKASDGTSGDAAVQSEQSDRPQTSDPVFAKMKWRLEFRDIPEVTPKDMPTSRNLTAVTLLEGDPLEMMDALGYE